MMRFREGHDDTEQMMTGTNLPTRQVPVSHTVCLLSVPPLGA